MHLLAERLLLQRPQLHEEILERKPLLDLNLPHAILFGPKDINRAPHALRFVRGVTSSMTSPNHFTVAEMKRTCP
jgi:hypothetical protein